MSPDHGENSSWRHEQPENGEDLSNVQKEKHRIYVDKGGQKGPKEWLSTVRNWSYRSQYGDDFRDGMAIVHGWTDDNGWAVEHNVVTDKGSRRYDAGKDGAGATGHETKYGKVSGKHPHEQLDKDEAALKRGRRVHWHVTDKSKVDKKIQRRLAALAKNHPKRFTFSQVSEAEKNLAMALGKEMRAHRAGNGMPLPSYYDAQRNLAETHADTIRKLKKDGPGGTSPAALDGGKSLVAEVKARTKALNSKSSALKDSLKAMRDHGVAHAKMVASWAKAPKGLANLTKAMKNSSTAGKSVQGATKSWIGAHGKINASMMKSPLGMIALGIAALIGVVTLIVGNWDTVQKVFEAVRKNTLEPVGKFFGEVFASATSGLSNVTKGISDSFSDLGSGVEGVFKTVVHHVAIVVNAIGSVLQRVNLPMPDWLGGGSIGFGFIGDAMVEWAAAHMATGGVVRGPGGPRDDQVPIMASNGEFVVNAASTSRHIALLEAINSDSLTINGRDAQVVAVRHDAFAVPSRALPHVVNRHHFDHSTTVNLTTNHIDSAHVRAKTLAVQREVAASWT
ncbi:hypothetical protein [Nocardia sp. NPDC058666]|uniref:hypothetical protein n=1 Tax=Nocardia sp. NPDC058666 TaxID=3346587 RepID=UPI00365F3337